MKIKNLSDLDDDPSCIKIHKPCTCTCLCLNRPEVLIEYTEEENQEFLGKIIDVWACCNADYDVYNSAGDKVFQVKATCWQCGIICMGCCCTKCETAVFGIFDMNGNKMTDIVKKNKDCIKNALTDSDNYGIIFTPEMDWKTRSLLIATTLFIDYTMFERKNR